MPPGTSRAAHQGAAAALRRTPSDHPVRSGAVPRERAEDQEDPALETSVRSPLVNYDGVHPAEAVSRSRPRDHALVRGGLTGQLPTSNFQLSRVLPGSWELGIGS